MDYSFINWINSGFKNPILVFNIFLCYYFTVVKAINKSVAQVIIKWHLQRGIVVLPKSVTKERIIANINVDDFELTADEMKQIFGIDRNTRTGSDPDDIS